MKTVNDKIIEKEKRVAELDYLLHREGNLDKRTRESYQVEVDQLNKELEEMIV